MACVYRNKYYRRCQGDTWWWIRYRDASGKDRRERAAPTKREAQKILAERVAAVNAGKKLPPQRDGSKLFSEFAAQYQETIAERQVWSASVATAIKHWQQHLGKRCRLREITPQRVEEFRTKRLKAGVRKSTVNRNVAVLKRLLTVAVDWDLLRENPVRRVKQYREENQRLRFLSHEEAKRLVAACRRSRNPLLAPLVVLALNTGARKGELLGLRWADVSFEARTLSFPKTKNGERRDLPLNKAATATLRSLHRRTGHERHVFNHAGEALKDIRTAWRTEIGIGLAIGAVVTVWLTRGLTEILFQVDRWDPTVLVGVPVILIFTGLLACFIPARRASAVDPSEAMRG